jgi:hypothetical protein
MWWVLTCKKKSYLAGHQWLPPVILDTQEAEIGIAVQNQSGQIVCETLSGKYPTQKRTGRVTEVEEYLPSKLKVLNSNASTACSPPTTPHLPHPTDSQEKENSV